MNTTASFHLFTVVSTKYVCLVSDTLAVYILVSIHMNVKHEIKVVVMKILHHTSYYSTY